MKKTTEQQLLTRLLYILIFIYSCNNKPNEWHSAEHEAANRIFDSTTINFIESNSLPRQLYYNLDSLEIRNLNLIDSSFFLKQFQNREYTNYTGEGFYYNNGCKYYFFDSKNFSDKFLFTIIKDCGKQLEYAHFTVDKKISKATKVEILPCGSKSDTITEILKYKDGGKELEVLIFEYLSKNKDNVDTTRFKTTF